MDFKFVPINFSPQYSSWNIFYDVTAKVILYSSSLSAATCQGYFYPTTRILGKIQPLLRCWFHTTVVLLFQGLINEIWLVKYNNYPNYISQL